MLSIAEINNDLSPYLAALDDRNKQFSILDFFVGICHCRYQGTSVEAEVMDPRPTKDEYFLTLAHAVSARSTCVRRPGGCVLVNGLGHIVGTGYNGRPAGYPHCNDISNQFRDDFLSGMRSHQVYPYACRDAFAPSGTKPVGCEAVHAEMNAVLQCYDTLWIDTCYCTSSPCIATCLKALQNTSCRRIVFSRASSDAEIAKEMWLRNNDHLNKLPPHMRKVRVWDHIITVKRNVPGRSQCDRRS